MRVVLAVAWLAALAVAGCFGGGSGPDAAAHATHTRSQTPQANHPPRASILASAANGSVPLNVTFALDGSDVDGDALNWTLVVMGAVVANGTGLPATVDQTFDAVGNHTVHLEVDDGQATSSTNMSIRAEPRPPAFVAVLVEAQDFPSSPAASATVPVVGYAGGAACMGFWEGSSGLDCVFFALDPAWVGLAFNATADVGDPDLEFWPSCDPSEVFAMAGYAGDGPEAGKIPSGASCVVIWNGAATLATPTHRFTVA